MKAAVLPVRPDPALPPLCNRPPVHDAQVLTQGKRQAVIILNGMRYTLHITKQGKLLLTK